MLNWKWLDGHVLHEGLGDMDLVPANMIANATPHPSAAAAAAAAGSGGMGFAALLNMVEQSAAWPSAGKNQEKPRAEAKVSPLLAPASLNSETPSARRNPGKKVEDSQIVAAGPAILLPAPVPVFNLAAANFPIPIASGGSIDVARPEDSAASVAETPQAKSAPAEPQASAGMAGKVIVAGERGAEYPQPFDLPAALQGDTTQLATQDSAATIGSDFTPGKGIDRGTGNVKASAAQTGIGYLEKATPPPVQPPNAILKPGLPVSAPPTTSSKQAEIPAHAASSPENAGSDITPNAKHTKLTEQSSNVPAEPHSPTVLDGSQPGNAVPDVKHVIAAVTAAAAHVVGGKGSHETVKVPSLNAKVSPVALPDSQLPIHNVENVHAENSGPRSHVNAASERVRKDEAPALHPLESATAPVEASVTSSESAALGPRTSLAAPQDPGTQQNLPDSRESSSLPLQAAPSPTHSAAPQDAHHSAVLVNSASLLQQVDKSELKLGMRVSDFGEVEIRTQMDRQQLKAEISVEHHDLGHALSAELPSLQQRLHEQNVPLISLNVTGHGAGGSNSQGGPKYSSPLLAPSQGELAVEKTSEINVWPESSDTKAGLDVRI